MTPDTRRTARTFERIFFSITGLALLAIIIKRLEGDAAWLGWIAMGLLITNGIREFMIGSENVAARIGLTIGNASGELDSRPEVTPVEQLPPPKPEEPM